MKLKKKDVVDLWSMERGRGRGQEGVLRIALENLDSGCWWLRGGPLISTVR